MNQAIESSPSVTPAAPLKQLPLRYHHYAIPVYDMEATRHFMEDIIGMPLVAAWCETTPMLDSTVPISYIHAFFGLEDGSVVAFFQFADKDYERRVMRPSRPEIGRFDHLALKATRATIDEIKARCEKWNVPHRTTNHGYVKSIYVTSPDGLYLEFAEEPPYAEEMWKKMRETAHEDLRRWMSGDHSTHNNPYRFMDF
jgi:catechol 2,3-dioxygenase-like lactoylglutathione lyase family enzyme